MHIQLYQQMKPAQPQLRELISPVCGWSAWLALERAGLLASLILQLPG